MDQQVVDRSIQIMHSSAYSVHFGSLGTGMKIVQYIFRITQLVEFIF